MKRVLVRDPGGRGVCPRASRSKRRHRRRPQAASGAIAARLEVDDTVRVGPFGARGPTLIRATLLEALAPRPQGGVRSGLHDLPFFRNSRRELLVGHTAIGLEGVGEKRRMLPLFPARPKDRTEGGSPKGPMGPRARLVDDLDESKLSINGAQQQSHHDRREGWTARNPAPRQEPLQSDTTRPPPGSPPSLSDFFSEPTALHGQKKSHPTP